MNKVAIAVLALVVTTAISLPANAQFASYSFGINGTQAQLQSRIQTGMRNGSLTKSEAATLQTKLNSIASMEASMRANGLNSRERMRLNSKLTKLSNDIEREMNDFQRRHNGNGWNNRGNGRNHHGWYR